jgi:hypothetical protein
MSPHLRNYQSSSNYVIHPIILVDKIALQVMPFVIYWEVFIKPCKKNTGLIYQVSNLDQPYDLVSLKKIRRKGVASLW